MKHSLVNDKGMSATMPTNYPGEGNNMGVKPKGPTSAPQEKLLAGTMVSFKNAEENSAEEMKSYNCEY